MANVPSNMTNLNLCVLVFVLLLPYRGMAFILSMELTSCLVTWRLLCLKLWMTAPWKHVIQKSTLINTMLHSVLICITVSNRGLKLLNGMVLHWFYRLKSEKSIRFWPSPQDVGCVPMVCEHRVSSYGTEPWVSTETGHNLIGRYFIIMTVYYTYSLYYSVWG